MKDVTLVCHSFGGRVGIKLASKYGYYIKKLILVDSAGIRPRRGIKYYCKTIIHQFCKRFKIKHKAGSKDYRSLHGAMRKTFINVINEDLTDELYKIKAKTLIIWGNKDKETPIYMAKRLNKKIKNSKLIVFNGCGHFAYVECNARFCIVVESFLSDVLGMDTVRIANRVRRNVDDSIPDVESK